VKEDLEWKEILGHEINTLAQEADDTPDLAVGSTPVRAVELIPALEEGYTRDQAEDFTQVRVEVYIPVLAAVYILVQAEDFTQVQKGGYIQAQEADFTVGLVAECILDPLINHIGAISHHGQFSLNILRNME
jgi:hypothetical protein